MGLQRSRLEVELPVLVLLGILVTLSNAQLDYRPGPPYPDTHSGHGPRIKFGQTKLPLVTPDILRTLNKAFGSGVPVYPPAGRQTRNPHPQTFISSSPTQVRYSSSPSRSQPFQPEYSSNPQNAQTAHVYFSQDVQKPMPNVIVKFQPSQAGSQSRYRNYGHNHVQPVQQYSQPDPVVHQSVHVVQYSGSGNQNQYQPSAGQSGHGQSQGQTYPASAPTYPQSKPQQYATATAFKPESQTRSPLTFSLNLEYPPRPKKYRGPTSKPLKQLNNSPQSSYFAHPVKTYTLKPYTVKKGKKSGSKKPLHTEAFPVFTVLGRGLDGLNAVRRGVKKGTGSVMASGVKLGGKLAGIGAGVVANVIKAASSI